MSLTFRHKDEPCIPLLVTQEQSENIMRAMTLEEVEQAVMGRGRASSNGNAINKITMYVSCKDDYVSIM